MAHATDRTEIVNAALLGLGSQTITTAQLTGSQTDLGKMMDNLLKDSISDIAARHDWQSLTKLAHLSTAVDNSSSEDFEFNQYFALPSDFVRMVDRPWFEDIQTRTTTVHYPDYKIANNRIYTNANYIDFYYVWFNYTDDDFWTAVLSDKTLRKALIDKVRAEATFPLTKNSSQSQFNEAKAALKMKTAVVANSSLLKRKQEQQSRILQVRYRSTRNG